MAVVAPVVDEEKSRLPFAQRRLRFAPAAAAAATDKQAPPSSSSSAGADLLSAT